MPLRRFITLLAILAATIAPAFAAEGKLLPQAVLAAGSTEVQSETLYEIYRATGEDGLGDAVISGPVAQYTVPPGRYFVRARLGHAEVTQVVDIVDGQTATPTFVLNAGKLVLRPRAGLGGAVRSDAIIVIDMPVGEDLKSYGETSTYLPAGSYKVTATIGAATLSQTITIAAGQTLEHDLVVETGSVSVTTDHPEDIDPSLIITRILYAQPGSDGQRQDVEGALTMGAKGEFDLPPGDYVALSLYEDISVEAPFTVASGAKTDVKASLRVGRLQVNAANAIRISIRETVTPTPRDQKEVAFANAPFLEATLPGGDYRIALFGRGDLQAVAKATVSPGELTVIEAPLDARE